MNAVVAWILQEVAKSASRLWKLCTGKPSSAYIWGTRWCDMAATATQVILDTPAAEAADKSGVATDRHLIHRAFLTGLWVQDAHSAPL